MESLSRFKKIQPNHRSRRSAARGGKIAIVTIFAILGLIVMAGFMGNVGQVVTTKVSAQNAADAVAFSSAQWMARGMNAATATNHMIGEVTGLCVVIEALGGPELDAGMKSYTSQNQMLDSAMDAIYELAPAPEVSPYPTEILNFFEEPLFTNLHAVMVPDGDEAKKSKVWATVYDAKLQLKLDVDMWLGVDALSNLLFLVPPPFGYPTAIAGFGVHIAADVLIVEDAKEWLILMAVETVLESHFASEFKNLLETTFIPALVAHGDFIAGQLSSKSGGGTSPTGGIVSAAVGDAVDHLGKTYDLKAFIFPEAARFRMPIEREPGPSLNEGTPPGKDEPEWGTDVPLTLPDVSSKLSDTKDKADKGRQKIVDRISSLNDKIADLGDLKADINDLEGQDGVTADERQAFETEKGKIDKDVSDDNAEIAELNKKLQDMDSKRNRTDQAMAALGNMSETGNLSAKRPHLALSPQQMKESEERYTQWARATFPYVDSFRAPILKMFGSQLSRSGAAGHYEKWTNRYALTKTFQFRSGLHFEANAGSDTDGSWQGGGEKLAMYVMRDAYAKSGDRRDQKGHEPWTLSTDAGKQQAEKLFTVIGLTHRDLKPLFSPVIYPSGDKHGATTFAQAVFYNSNEQKPDPINAKSATQAKLGWDTLNWDPKGNAPEWGHRLAKSAAKYPWDVLTSSSSNSSSAKVLLNWQAKLMPVTKTRLQGAVTMPMSADMNANVTEAYTLFDRMVTH